MSDPVALLPLLRSSTAGLVQGVDGEHWSDMDIGAPSLLPGWSRGHVLTHVARNADGIARTLSGALRGERLERYPGGRAGRNADIEAGAPRPVSEQIADVRESAERLDRVFAAVASADGWALPTEDRPAGEYVLARLVEVEVHRVDLAGDYSADGWPPEFVGRLLPDAAAGLSERSERALHLIVTPDGSLTQELPGQVYRSPGDGEPLVVSGPDWALLAWLLGRPAAAADALSATPDLAPWR